METKFSPEFASRDKALFTKYLDEYVNKFNARIGYGTAGFRIAAQYLEHIAFRSGVFASYLARLYQGHVVGVQITASHNPLQDNGIKFIGIDGLMMKTELEKPVEDFANIEDLGEACKMLENFLVEKLNGGKAVDWNNIKGHVLVGCDTRTSSPLLIGNLMEGITFSGSSYLNFGTVTTPQLHYMVLTFNKRFRQDLPKFDYNTDQLLNIYYEDFGGAILKAFDLLSEMGLKDKTHKKKVVVDCSNGVGGIHQEKMTQAYFNKIFDVTVINSKDTEYLNVDCGSEFVQKEKKVPRGLLNTWIRMYLKQNLDHMSFLSYDGDADRTVFYRAQRGSTEADLFEGDKLGALYALFCQRTLNKITDLQKKLHGVIDLKEDFTQWTIGAALTAYANGNAQKYYRDTLKVNLLIEPTGVKHLHRAAEKFDIGVYFESNGHGTVVYDHNKIHKLEEAVTIAEHAHSSKIDQQKEELTQLYYQLRLLYLFLIEANQGVGDAISNFLQIETALAALQMTAADWKIIYTDLHNANSKVVVKNKSVIKVNRDQSKVVTPPEIQPKIDEICGKYEMGRAFIRPSGTEDICRLYVEAAKDEDVKAIQQQITEYILSNKDVN